MATKLDNLFKKSSDVAKSGPKLKVLLRGDKSTGKTKFGLMAPGPVFGIDTQAGMDLYVTDVDVPEFSFLPVSTYDGVISLLTDIAAAVKQGEKIGTLVVDSITDIYFDLVGRHSNKQTGRPEKQDWQVIKIKWQHLMNLMTSLNCHVVMTVQEKTNIDKEVVENADAAIGYWGDVTLQLTRQGKNVTGKVTKEMRGSLISVGKTIPNITFDKLYKVVEEAIAARYAEKKTEGRVTQTTQVIAGEPGPEIFTPGGTIVVAPDVLAEEDEAPLMNQIAREFSQCATRDEAKRIYDTYKGSGQLSEKEITEELQPLFKTIWTKLPAA